ncbi:hypothetical protein COC42_14955 [Sphingomonas spermidinifaciens]|uniref:Uncharacterized protein n=1 Tax=Sphingomonas spermidinifaciens TaxID=1141889 RepID=A0A2A4B0G5_9SPHN|nr:DUF1178 family protein [Sphingomonas spermidinifaciens]PCD02683.1 hypothetical protein COC42_14955 [Sphingomonas spermidinifaciens]
MIVFDLRCGHGHVFEAWFGSSAAYEEQRAGGLVECPMCGSAEIEKAVMAPNVGAKGNQRAAVPAKGDEAPSPEAIKAALAAMAAAQAKALEKSQWVGTAFADQARAMHVGDAPEAPIHGQASLAEAKALAEEGVPIAPLLFPVVPPETRN